MALLWIYFAVLCVPNTVLESYQRPGQTEAGDKACCWDPARPGWSGWCFGQLRLLQQNTINWEAETIDTYFSQFWRLGSPSSRCWLIPFPVGASSWLVDRWLPSPCVLTWQRSGELWSFSSYKDTNLSQGPHLHGLF